MKKAPKEATTGLTIALEAREKMGLDVMADYLEAWLRAHGFEQEAREFDHDWNQEREEAA
jgi:hypothetical protein